ncbi:hypothetical protein [Pasteuria penetrans]|uniref:hypothetical protein n=1 Tax=Pasteuria penetrans TaxID=86005 RepID=UPI000F99BB58|nr:hypothetical protein [Pasteuria penetrans]
MASHHCNTIPNNNGTEETETSLQNRILSALGPDQPTDVEFIHILLGLFFTGLRISMGKGWKGPNL